MKVYKAFLLFSRGKQIAIAVCTIHLLAIVGLLGHHLISRRLKPPRPMIVRTISPIVNTERKFQIAKKETAAPAPKAKPAETKLVTAAPKAKAAPQAQKTAPSKSIAVAKKAAPAQQESSILKEIADSFETFSPEPKRSSRPTLNLPSKIQPKAQLAEAETNDDPTYGEFLIAFLQNALDLPEYGEVRAKIEIDRFGRLIDCKIVQAKSAKNAEFLKNQLPELTFPCLNDFGIVDATQTFTITFRNVEIH